MPTKETVIRNEIVRVNGKVKAITIPKEKTQEILKRVELRLLDKKYEVLMPSVDNMDKNKIDLQGMMTFIQGYLSMFFGSFPSNTSSPNVQIVITTTSGSKYQLNYANTVTNNAQGVTTAIQIFGPQNSMTVQYYFIGFDTTNNAYQANYLELYSGSWIDNCYPIMGNTYCFQHYSNIVRIAYANLSINKQSNYDLFVLWLIEFQNVPSYLVMFIPIIPNPSNIYPNTLNSSSGSSFTVYANNGSCNFTCGGNCPSNSPNNFMLSIQNNTIVLQIPVMIGISGGTSSAEILICGKASYNVDKPTPNVSFSSSYSTTITPPSSGYVFYILMTTIAITFKVS
jgi:hypothetical protein